MGWVVPWGGYTRASGPAGVQPATQPHGCSTAGAGAGHRARDMPEAGVASFTPLGNATRELYGLHHPLTEKELKFLLWFL